MERRNLSGVVRRMEMKFKVVIAVTGARSHALLKSRVDPCNFANAESLR